LENILINYFSQKAIFTGFKHNFGKGKTGDTKFLEDNSLKYGYKYFMIEPQKIENELISSTQIRKYLNEGNIKKANKMLGYKFSISGIVIKGKQIGRQLGFRTANILMPEKITDMPFGAYSTDITYKDKVYKGVTNYGLRPTVGKTSLATIETHILDFDKDIYGEEITVEFTSMLRPEKKFLSLDELKKQISEDINFIK
jgi:riboflavin kinase/FMN adenylyltransferase